MGDTKSDHLLPSILGRNGVSSDQMTSQFCVECSAELLAPRCNQCGAAKVAGEFTILKLIAGRPSGRVYLAEGPKGLRVALKELVFAVVPHIEDLDRFERGSELLRQLSHPGIPRFLAAFHVGEGVHTRLYLAAEYVEGENLLEMLNTYRFSEADVREIAVQVLSMLEYLHNLSP